MARPQKATMDYFPLDSKFSDSIKCIKAEFGNDGELFWVRLLQALCRHEYHYIDLRECNNKRSLFYVEDVGFDVSVSNNILNKLAEYESIDPELYSNGIIFSQKFVENVKDAYRKRTIQPMNKNEILKNVLGINKAEETLVFGGGNEFLPEDIRFYGGKKPQRKENKSKTNKNKFIKPTVKEIQNYCLERNNNIDAEYFYNYYESKGWLVGKSKMKDYKAAIRTWEQNQQKYNKNNTNNQENVDYANEPYRPF